MAPPLSSMQVAFVCLILASGGCAKQVLLPDKPVAALNDVELVLAYRHSIRKTLSTKGFHDELDREIQARRLLTTVDVALIQSQEFKVGVRSAVALALLGPPWKLGTSDKYPGIQLWLYSVDTKNNSPLFVSRGRVIGTRVAKNPTSIDIQWQDIGTLFPVDDFPMRQCNSWTSRIHEITTNCPDLDIR